MVSISTVARMVPRGTPRYSWAKTKHVVPQARFEVALHLGQIEVRARAFVHQRADVVEEEEAEIEERRPRWAGHPPRNAFRSRCQPRGRTRGWRCRDSGGRPCLPGW